MPSGSHRGGHGGSHGGSHGGGGGHSSWSGGRIRGGRSVGPRRIYFFWGRTRYVVGTTASAFISFMLVLFVFAVFGIFVSSVLRSSASSELRTIRQDYVYYHSMIEDAKANPNLIVNGVVKTKFYNDTVNKWYVTYKFEAADGSFVDGYTFALYSNEEAMKFKTNDIIPLAVDGVPITQETDSIPLDYESMPIEQDGYYNFYISQRKGAKIAQGVCIAFAVGFVAISIVIAITNKKRADAAEGGAGSSASAPTTPKKVAPVNNKEDEKVERDFDENVTYCQYCGATMKKGKLKCPECGAKQDR